MNSVDENDTFGEAESQQDLDSMVIDFDTVDEDATAFPVIPRGMYPAVVESVEFGASKTSGNPMWTWRFEITEGEFAGRKLFFHTPFTENMLPRVKKILGRIYPSLTGAFKPAEIAAEGSLVGIECCIRVDVRPYLGKPSNNVKDVLPPRTGGADDGSFL